MNEYKKFSYYYDEVMSNLNYSLWYDFIYPYLKKDMKILDLGCGSGTLLNILALNGYNCSGLDLSESIIEIAKEKAKINHLNINYYVSDMTSYKLNDKFDLVTSFFDSINFLKSFDDIKKTFEVTYNHLNKDGLFIIDIFSKVLLNEYENNVINEDYETFKILWKTHLTSNTSLKHTIKISDFNDEFTEEYEEYYYDKNLFDFKGFKLIKLAGDFNDDYQDDDERILMVFKKID